MGEKLNILMNRVHSQTSDVQLYVVMLQDDSFLLLMYVTQFTTKILESLKVESNIDDIPVWQQLDHYAAFIMPNDSSCGLTG
jgi:hypothetical protein